MLTTKQFKLVKTIIDHGSLQQASSALHLSQSALSHQLKKLEDEIQILLFERSASGLKVTEAGKVIYKYALRIEDELSSIHQEITDIRSKQRYQYTHGYSDFEANRLLDQANTVADFIHNDSYWPAGSVILEVGCGIGAQSKIIAHQNPGCTFFSIDISEESIAAAQANETLQQLDNISFKVLDAYQVGVLNRQFDHIFLCFVLEHITNPSSLLKTLKKYLKPGGSLTLVEGDHGSTYFFPESTYASKAVEAQVNFQKMNGGNANIGRALYPLLAASGYERIKVTPRNIYVDDNNPELKENFILKTFTSMIEGVCEKIVNHQIETTSIMKKGILDLKQTQAQGGTFNYTFFKGIGFNGST